MSTRNGQRVSGEELLRTAKFMGQILAVQHSKRHEYKGIGWLDVEVDVMHHAVNVDRSKRGLPDVSRHIVVRHEAMAAGHSDYASKFALYCAELALGISTLKETV